MTVSKRGIIESADDLRGALLRIREAQKKFADYTQSEVDKIFAAAASAANKQRIPLAKMAVSETGMGVAEDKVIKNNINMVKGSDAHSAKDVGKGF